jgi:hypothetical protein
MATSEVKFMAEFKSKWGQEFKFEEYAQPYGVTKPTGGVTFTIDEDLSVTLSSQEDVQTFISLLQAFSNGVTLEQVTAVPDDKHVTFPEDEDGKA